MQISKYSAFSYFTGGAMLDSTINLVIAHKYTAAALFLLIAAGDVAIGVYEAKRHAKETFKNGRIEGTIETVQKLMDKSNEQESEK
jgi:hypothetical protein